MQWTAPLQRHRNVPICDSNGPAASPLLAFSERQLLAITGRKRDVHLTGSLPPTSDIEIPVSGSYVIACHVAIPRAL